MSADNSASTSATPRASGVTRLTEHLARHETSVLTALLDPATASLLGKLGADITSPAGLAYFVVSVHGDRGALRRRDIRDLLLSKLERAEATDLCNVLQLPVFSALQTLRAIDFDATPHNLETLERWYEVAHEDLTAPPQLSEGSQRAIATHKLHAHQFNAFRELRRAIGHPPASVLVHMPFGAGKLRLVATAALDLFRSEADDRSIVWFAPGAAMCDEAFRELHDVWRQLGSRDATIYRLYGTHPLRDLNQIGGAIAVIDILKISEKDAALKSLGAVASVVVFADAECLVHPVGAEIVRRMREGGGFSTVGVLGAPGATVSEGTNRDALKAMFPGPNISIKADDELQALRHVGDFKDVESSVVHLTNLPTGAYVAGPSALPGVNQSLSFEDAYIDALGRNVERNERLLDILKSECSNRGRILLYAATAENARLFAGLLPVLGVKARAVTSEDSPAIRDLVIQRFVFREERVLCVHGLLISGSSIPDLTACVIAAPDRSRAVLLSIVGRLVQARRIDQPPLKIFVAADSQVDADWVNSLKTWSTLDF